MFKKKTEKAAAAETDGDKTNLQPQIYQLGLTLRRLAHEERIQVQELQSSLARRLQIAGDLEGAVITANECARHNPERAFDTLARAEAAFKKATK